VYHRCRPGADPLMPTTALPPQAEIVVVWEMPFAESATNEFVTANPGVLQGDSRKSFLEGVQAIRRFRSSMLDGIASLAPTPACMLNPLAPVDNLQAFSKAQGLDLDALLFAAAQHFHSPSISRWAEPLSDEALERLFEDDQRAFDR